MGKKIEYYKPFSEWKWTNYDRTEEVSVDEFVKKHMDKNFYIGTDSQEYKSHVIFTTVLVAHKKTHGGSIILHTDRKSKLPSLRQKLIMEVMRSLELAWNLDGKIPNSFMSIHVDVNESLKFKSGQYINELVGMVMGQGFVSFKEATFDTKRTVTWKPHAWASSNVADRKN